jgi:hypothetical protein
LKRANGSGGRMSGAGASSSSTNTQDTNAGQYRLTKLLAGERQNICAVGDDGVGRDRARYLAARLSIPPLPPCVRLSPHTATPGEDFWRLGSADLSETSPALTPYGTSSEDGYFAHLSRCGPSPCTRLSRAPSTMTTLTLSRRLGGFRSCFQPPTSALLTIV